MSKHTKVEWVAVGGMVEVAEDGIADICSCRPEDFWQEHLGRTHEEVFANARLIAAAPDLLEALVYLWEKAEDSDDACKGVLTTDFVRKVIQPAIAKATGEQS